MIALKVDSFFLGSRGYALESEALASIGVQLKFCTLSTEDQLISGAREAGILLVEHSSTPLTRRVIQSLPRCRLIAKYGVGVDNIDLVAASECGIVVCHSPGYCTDEVSDHTLSLILACARRTFVMDRHVRAGGWHELTFQPPIHRFREQTVGLMGFGRIARRVAEKLSGWKGRTIACDPNIKASTFANAGVEQVSFAALLAQSDYLSLHLPLTDETYHILGAEALSYMRRTAFVINTSRGAVIDESALIAALCSGRLQGAALDVTEQEPNPPDSPLRILPNVLLTPHLGAYSQESVQHLRETILRSIIAFCAGLSPPYVANAQSPAARSLGPCSLGPGEI